MNFRGVNMSTAVLENLKGMIGKELYRFQNFPVEKGKIREFCNVLRMNNPVFYDEKKAQEAGFRSIPAPLIYSQAYVFFNDSDFPFEELGLDLRYILHGEKEYDYYRPLVAGDVLSAVCRIADVYEKEGKRGGKMIFLVTELEFTDQHGEKVLTSKQTFIQTGKVVEKE